MANIALVTDDMNHVAYTMTRDMLIEGGHNIIGYTNPTLAQLITHDVVVAVRTTSDIIKSNIIRAASDAGIPCLVGLSIEAGTNVPAVSLGLCSYVNDGSQSEGSSLIINENNIFQYGYQLTISPYLSSDYIYYINNDKIAKNAIILGKKPNTTQITIAMLMKGQLDINNKKLNSAVAFCGFLYGRNIYSNDGKQVILNLIDNNSAAAILKGIIRDSNYNLLSRKIRAYSRDDGKLAGETISDPLTGLFEIKVYNTEKEYTVICYGDDDEENNAKVKDRVKAVPKEDL